MRDRWMVLRWLALVFALAALLSAAPSRAVAPETVIRIGEVLVEISSAFLKSAFVGGVAPVVGKWAAEKLLKDNPPPTDGKSKTYQLPNGQLTYQPLPSLGGQPRYKVELQPGKPCDFQGSLLLSLCQHPSGIGPSPGSMSRLLQHPWPPLGTRSLLPQLPKTPTPPAGGSLGQLGQHPWPPPGFQTLLPQLPKPLLPGIVPPASPPAHPAPDLAAIEQAIRSGNLWETAQIRNDTDSDVVYYVLNPDGSWFTTVLHPHHTYIHWRRDMGIVVNFDHQPDVPGYQARERPVHSSMTIGHPPDAAERGQAPLSVFVRNEVNELDLLSR